MASWPSRRFRSRMSTCDSDGLDQMAGSESLDSKAASSLSMRAWSKILPKVAHLIADRSVGKFEFIRHEALPFSSKCSRCGRAQVSAADGGKNTKADYPTEIGEEVAVLGVEGQVAAVAVLGGQGGECVAGHAGSEPSVGIDDGGEAGVGVA